MSKFVQFFAKGVIYKRDEDGNPCGVKKPSGDSPIHNYRKEFYTWLIPESLKTSKSKTLIFCSGTSLAGRAKMYVVKGECEISPNTTIEAARLW